MHRTTQSISPLAGASLAVLFGGCAAFAAPVASAADAAPATGAHCAPAPLGETDLYLRGSPNGWGASDEYVFAWACDAYYLNVDLLGRHEFKIADAAWTPATTYGGRGGDPAEIATQPLELGNDSEPGRTGNLAFRFDGEHTIRVSLPAAGGRPTISIGARTFSDPHIKRVENPIALSARFDSRDAADKAPFGAVPAGTAIAFGFDALRGIESATLVVETRRLEGNQEVLEYAPLVELPMAPSDAGDGRERWRAQWTPDAIGVYGYHIRFRVRGDAAEYVLQNNNAPLYWTRERGAGGAGVVDHLPERRLRRFRQTVHDPAFVVPDWAQDAVYYYIFPERFRNGDPDNDPVPGVARYHDATVETHPRWIGVPYRPGDGSDAYYNNDFFGGDIAGIIEKLDDIRDLGANTLYITPLLRASSNHKYDTADYREIDPGFGSNADYERLTREAARRGLRVVMDTSFNHTGRDSLYFDRYGNFGGQGAFAGGKVNPASPYADWYLFDTSRPDPDSQYRGWVGVADLPETDKSSRSFRDFVYNDDDAITRLWLRRGAAGWRMDVAPWVPDDFWREWRRVVKHEKPDALTIAETWFDASKHLLGDTFDSTMNYIFRNAVLDFAGGTDARRVWPAMEHLREAYPPQAFHALMNLLSTHDQARSLHVLGWHGTQPPTRRDAEYDLAKRKLLLAITVQMTWPGSPAIYYGDEVGLGGGDDPMNRLPYPWPDQGGRPDLDMRKAVRNLVHLRRDHPVLARGDVGAPLHIDAHTVAVLRSLGDTRALVAWNNADTPQTFTVATSLPSGTALRGLHNTGDLRVDAHGRVTLTVPALGGVVLLGNQPAR
jgi:cyclomaltodextrinase